MTTTDAKLICVLTRFNDSFHFMQSKETAAVS